MKIRFYNLWRAEGGTHLLTIAIVENVYNENKGLNLVLLNFGVEISIKPSN